MSNRESFQLMTEEEYLDSEETSAVRHEFIDGHVFAMSGVTKAHSKICGNIFYLLRGRLGSGPCEAHMSDMKQRIKSLKSYYYPDLIVDCEAFDPKSAFVEEPIILFEVLSPSTSQIDRREKLIAYKKISSLQEYVIVHQDQQRIEIHRRKGKSWECTVLTPIVGKELVLESMPGGPLIVPFSLVYEGYNPPSRVKEIEATYEPVT